MIYGLLNLLEDYRIVFYLCLLLHFIADFSLQGILGKLKQKGFWSNHANFNDEPVECRAKWCDGFYHHDWVPCLFAHSMMWSVFTFLPLLFLQNCEGQFWRRAFELTVLANALVHAVVDDLKCNRYKINLAVDQLIHLLQIFLTIGVWLVVMGVRS